MTQTHKHNQSNFTQKTNRLIFLQKTTDTTLDKTKDLSFLSEEDLNNIKGLDILNEQEIQQRAQKKNKGKEVKTTTTGQKLLDQYQDTEKHINEKTFRKIADIAKDPNKMAKKPYKDLIKGIAEGRIYVEGDLGAEFLDTILSGLAIEEPKTPEEADKKSSAEELVRKVASGKVVSKRLVKAEMKKIKGQEESLREETAERETALTETSAAAMKTTETGTTLRAIEKSTELPTWNWKVEQPPQELVSKWNYAMKEEAALARKQNTIAQENDKLKSENTNLESELANEKAQKTVNHEKVNEVERQIAKNKDRIQANQKQIHEIQKQINTLNSKNEKTRQEWIAYLTKTTAQFNAISFFTKRVGVDINKYPDLTMKGVKIDPDTGAFSKSKQGISIKSLFFESKKELTPPESPGELMVEYTWTKGDKPVTIVENAKNFIDLIRTYGGYEEIETEEDFYKKYSYELAWKEYKNITEMKGEKFSVLKLHDTAKQPRDKELSTITIEKVLKKEGKWYVQTSEPVATIDTSTLPRKVSKALGSPETQELELGEFGAYLRRNLYQREYPDSELPEITKKMLAEQREECASYMAAQGATEAQSELFEAIGGIPDYTATLPAQGQTKNYKYAQGAKERVAQSWLEKDKNGNWNLKISYSPTDPGRPRGMPRLPDEPTLPVTRPSTPAEAVELPRVKRIDTFDKHNYMEAVNKGDIQDLPTETTDDDDAYQTDKKELDEEGFPIKKEEKEYEDSGGGPLKSLGGREAFNTEALAFEDIYKTGGMETKETSFIKSLWTNTAFLSISDVWEMGKAMYEYHQRRFERRQKGRYSAVGKELPYWAPEMKRINQAAENDQVNQFKESFDQIGIQEIQKRLQKTHNRDEFKAGLVTLNEKGQMRWDDIDFWKNLNRFVDPKLAIPIPQNGDPATRISDTDERTGMAFLKDAIDSLWGEGTYNNWFRQNKSTYASNIKGYYEEGKELEGVQGGHGRRLSELLKQHKEGFFVDPHEFEGLLQHSIDAGKAFMQEKLYYMVEGIAGVNKYGNTIMSFDRMAHLNSEMLRQFPILEYLCADVQRPDGQTHRWTIDDYKEWVRRFDMGNNMNHAPTSAVDDFLWEHVVPSDHTQDRINKVLRDGEKLDHDDMFAYIPPATERVVTDACKATAGSKKFLTIEGYANAVPGFSQYFKTLAHHNNKDKLVEAVKSYIRYSGIMKNRFEKARADAQDNFQRLDDATLNSATIVSTTHPQQYMNEMDEVLQNVIAAYDDPELNSMAELIFNEPVVEDMSDPAERKRQDKINLAYHQFGRKFHQVVQDDDGDKMVAMMDAANLMGMGYTTPEEKIRQRAEIMARKGSAIDE
jgi:hypothetical protein